MTLQFIVGIVPAMSTRTSRKTEPIPEPEPEPELDFSFEDPPPKDSPSGRQTRYQPIIEEAKANPGQWIKLAGEHHTGNAHTLKKHGLKVRTKRGDETHKHQMWVVYMPTDEET